MKKLYTLKSWFSLPDVAERLSSSLGETVTQKDIVQLVVEGHIPLSWMVRDAHARKVAWFTELVGKGLNPKLSDWVFSENPSDATTYQMRHETWVAVEDYIPVHTIKGIFRIEFDYSLFALEWLHARLMGTQFSQGTPDGLIISDNSGEFWQLMELAPNIAPEDTWDFENQDKLFQPSSSLALFSELVIAREDIELFEQSLDEQDTPLPPPTLNPKAETTYLNIIGALLDIIAHGIPDHEQNKQIGPASEFLTTARLIASIVEHYRGYAGLSKRNLEKKLAEAKRSLEAS